jgi:O-antigen/teichoic acid export membrane protein
VLSWLLVPKYGTSGAAVAWLGGWVVILLLLGVVGQRKYPLQYEWRPLVLGGGLAAITVLVPLLNFVHFSWWWLAAQLGGSLTIILLVGMFLINDIRSMHQRYREA